MEPSNIETPYGIFVYSQNYNSKEYWAWAKNKANECKKSVPEDGTEEDYIIWLEGSAGKSTDPDDHEKLQDLIIAKKMLLDGKNEVTPFFNGLSSTWQHLIDASRKEDLERQKPVNVRGLDHDLYLRARAQAIREGKNIGEWLNKVIEDKLAQDAIDGA